MKYITGTLDFKMERKSVITLGKFDGLHRGHQKLVNRVLEIGEDGLETVVFTFDVSPVMRLGNGDSRVLLTNEERKELLCQTDIDYLIECPFTSAIRNMEPETFVKEVLVSQLKVAQVVVGPDFRFGCERKGTAQMLCKLGAQHNFKVEILDKVCDGEREISSSYIREEVKRGNIEKVNELLGYPYFITGEVIRGRHLGSTIGMPTINQKPLELKQLPPFGVYISKAYVGQKAYKGVSNIGIKPTVGSKDSGVETYLFDCNEDLYGLEAKVELFRFQRPEQKFESVEKLQEQLEIDKQEAQDFNV